MSQPHDSPAALATASLVRKGNLRLDPDSQMQFGKHKGLHISRVCQLYPNYMHWLIRDGVVKATAPICALIQEGYDARARELRAEFGSAKHNYTPITPEQAPTPTE